MNIPEMTDQQFKVLSSFIHKRFGIFLNDHKKTLLRSRMAKVLQQRNMDFAQYIQNVLPNPSKDDLFELSSQISTNHTYFDREPMHYQFVTSEVLPWLRARAERTGHREVRMWCCAASTGEEPYTLAMLQLDFFENDYAQWDAGLLATDISDEALAKAREGLYNAHAVEPLPPLWKRHYFKERPDGFFKVAEVVRKEVLFRRLNLMTPRFSFKKPFDVIFCRNVLIYFDLATKQALTKKFHDSLAPGGFLFLGMSESLEDPYHLFKTVKTAIYQRQ